MSLPFVFPQNNQPALDGNGCFNRPWFLFLQAVFQRIGGATGTGNTVLDGLIADLGAQLAMVPDSAAELTRLTRLVADIASTLDAERCFVAPPDAALARRVADLETLGVF